MHCNENDITAIKEALAMAAGVVQLWGAVKDSDDMDTIRSAIPELAAEFKPMLQGLSRFCVQLDIDAIKQMEEAGIERHYAVALRLRQPMRKAISEAAGKAATAAKAKKQQSN